MSRPGYEDSTAEPLGRAEGDLSASIFALANAIERSTMVALSQLAHEQAWIPAEYEEMVHRVWPHGYPESNDSRTDND
jgi:hypothetical protein